MTVDEYKPLLRQHLADIRCRFSDVIAAVGGSVNAKTALLELANAGEVAIGADLACTLTASTPTSGSGSR